METIRALIVDDEHLARLRIRNMLANYRDVEVVGDCGDGQSAIETIHALAPDVVFLDVQMPELNGVEVARRCQKERLSGIIFVTAYDEHAVQAFEFNAVDYLLKPFSEERFDRALARFRERRSALQFPEVDFQVRVQSAIQQILTAGSIDRLLVRSNNQMKMIDVKDIAWLEAAGKVVRVHTDEGLYELRQPLSQLESRLNQREFMRIHRSTIVRVNAIDSIATDVDGEFQVVLANGEGLSVSRRHRNELRERFGGK